MDRKKDKWNKCYQDADISSAIPAQILKKNSHLLPRIGKALDLACGRGGNAIFLANHGLDVDAFDSSSVIVNKLCIFSQQQKLTLSARLFDAEAETLTSKNYDIIIVSYFLDRTIFPNILNALKPNGLLFYQTWSQEKISERGPSSTRFRLKKGELLTLCGDLDLIYYREEGSTGDTSKGLRDEALYIGKSNTSNSQPKTR